MPELEDLQARADRYEQAFLTRPEGIENLFYYDSWDDGKLNQWWQALLAETTKGLKELDGGQQCLVYASKHYVLKLRHNVSGCHIDLRNSPDQALLDICGQYREACKETGWRHPLAAPYFLLFDYLTPQGLAAVQKRVDCSKRARLAAGALFFAIDPYLVRCNHAANYGLDGERPVYIDWD
jgi:hypothetical protein